MKRAAEMSEEQAKRMYVDPAIIATRYAQAGEKDKAFAQLEKAFADKSDFLDYIKTLQEFEPLRSDPRYADLLRRMNLLQ